MAEKIQLEFHNATGLSDNEEQIAEKMGMLLLASDFIGSRQVNKATDLNRISKANITYYLAKTKAGDYVAINPFSTEPLNVKLTQLSNLSEITEFVSDPSNLDLNELYNKVRELETKEAQILGGFNNNQIEIISKLLQAPKGNRKDFEKLRPTRDLKDVKNDIKDVNSLVYDAESLDKEIDERLDIIDKALKEEKNKYENIYKEREKFWQKEIENKNELLQKRLKEREDQLDKELEELEKEVDGKIELNLQKFKDGVAKNIRKDEKPIEKSIQALEKLVNSKTDRALVDKIEQELIKLEDFTKIFMEAVGFARRQVDVVKAKERDIYELRDIEEEKLRQVAEADKVELRKESDKKEKERDRELRELKADRDAAVNRYAKFRDVRDDWKEDIKNEVGKTDTPMIPRRLIPSSDDPSIVEFQIPTYVFQYTKDTETATLLVPPVKMPGNMRKPDRGSFYGDNKTVYYHLVVPETRDLIINWFADQSSERLDLQSNIQELKNYLDDSADLRDTFFNNTSLMKDKLKVDDDKFNSANSRLTAVFQSG